MNRSENFSKMSPDKRELLSIITELAKQGMKLPVTFQGLRINYDKPIYNVCPVCGGTCYQTFLTPDWAVCPRCRHIVYDYDDFQNNSVTDRNKN